MSVEFTSISSDDIHIYKLPKTQIGLNRNLRLNHVELELSSILRSGEEMMK